MAELAWRHSWVWALLLFGLYGLLSPDDWSSLVGLALLVAWALESRALRRAEVDHATGRGAQTALAGGLMILAGLIHLRHVGALNDPLSPDGVQSLLRLVLAITQVLWAVGEVRRFRRELERAG